MLAKLRERLKTPPGDSGVWTSRKAVAFMAVELGLAEVAVQRGWEALQATGWTPRARRVPTWPATPSGATRSVHLHSRSRVDGNMPG
jgi:hypothetical protein